MIQLRFTSVQIGIGPGDETTPLRHRLVVVDPESRISVVVDLDDAALDHLRGQANERAGGIRVPQHRLVVPHGPANGGRG